MVLELLAKSGSTILFSSHILSDLEKIATEIIILHEGRILLQENLNELKENLCGVEFETDRLPESFSESLSNALTVQKKQEKIIAVIPCSVNNAENWMAENLSFSPDTMPYRLFSMNLEELFIQLTGGG